MSTRVVLGLLFLAGAVVMGWFALQGKPLPFNLNKKTDTTNQTSFPTQTDQTPEGAIEGSDQISNVDKGGVAERVVVTYTDGGFGPKEITVATGSTVTFVNESSREMWVASGVYPSNQLLPDFNQNGSADKGGVYEYVFTKAGTWQYQNNKNPNDIGYVVVR